MTKEEMAARGYSRVFRQGFGLLGRYADAENRPETWEEMAREACRLYESTPEALRPLAMGILKGIYETLEAALAAPEEAPEYGEYYHFTL